MRKPLVKLDSSASNDLTSLTILNSFYFKCLRSFRSGVAARGRHATVNVPKLRPAVVGVAVCPAKIAEREKVNVVAFAHHVTTGKQQVVEAHLGT